MKHLKRGAQAMKVWGPLDCKVLKEDFVTLSAFIAIGCENRIGVSTFIEQFEKRYCFHLGVAGGCQILECIKLRQGWVGKPEG
jgi:hypothetical protein